MIKEKVEKVEKVEEVREKHLVIYDTVRCMEGVIRRGESLKNRIGIFELPGAEDSEKKPEPTLSEVLILIPNMLKKYQEAIISIFDDIQSALF